MVKNSVHGECERKLPYFEHVNIFLYTKIIHACHCVYILFYKNLFYKNVEAEFCLKFKNILRTLARLRVS